MLDAMNELISKCEGTIENGEMPNVNQVANKHEVKKRPLPYK